MTELKEGAKYFGMSDEMSKALEADALFLEQMTGESHLYFVEDPFDDYDFTRAKIE